jgi:hypothetical protein
MKKYFKTNLTFAILYLLMISCSSSNSLDSRIDNKYELEIGTIASDKVDNFLNRVTQRYGYEIARRENYSTLGGFYVETYWKEREAFDDEKTLNYEKIQTQLIFKSKVAKDRRSDLSYNSVYYDVEVEIRQKGKKMSSLDFEKFEYTSKGKDFVKDLAYEFKDYITGSLIQ